MSDYISREAAFKEFAEFVRGSNNSDFVDAPTWNDAVSLIGSLPAADVVEVVRCAECAVPHNRWTGCPKLGGLIPPDDFYCGFGRKDGDGDG